MKKLVLTYFLSSLFCVGSAHLFAEENIISHQTAKNTEEKADLDLEKPGHHHLELKDFAGDWILTVESIGGVAGPNATGDSIFVNAQVFIDRKGKGTINFASASMWNGQTLNIIDIPQGTRIDFSITDPRTGTGTFTVQVNSIHVTIEFVAVISKKTGNVLSIIGHRKSTDATVTSVVKVQMFRQFE